MKDKKKYIIIFGILAFYLILIFLYSGKRIVRENFDSSYIMVSPSTRWKLQKGSWNKAENIVEYSMKPFQIYIDNKSFGTYNVTYNDKFYLFDEKRNAVNYEGNMLAIKGSVPIEVINFKEEDAKEDISIINQIIKEKKIKTTLENSLIKKIKIDIDNDQKKESIYVITNAFDALPGENSFSIVCIIDDGKKTYLYEDINDYEHTLGMCVPFIQNIIDIDKDKNYEVIMGCEYFSNNGVCHNLYNNKTKQYEPILKNC